MRHRMGILSVAMLLAACMQPPVVSKTETVSLTLPPDLAQIPTFTSHRADPPQRPNAEILRDFMDLEFQLESGRPIPRLTRFEGPITVALTGDVPATVPADLTRLLTRLRDEAGLDIQPVAQGPASITFDFLPRRVIKANDPTVACFVAAGVSNWADYEHSRISKQTDWAALDNRSRMAIFIPSDTSPQEARDCLHEELAQALGPLNDLYRLTDSVFNDDNFNTVLTGFDMLMLRLHYAPELANGMTKAEVATRLPALLARLNPAGEGRPGQFSTATPRAWSDAMERALGPKGGAEARLKAANTALAIAQSEGWQDGRLAFSYFALGRSELSSNGPAAIAAFSQAATLYRALPGGRVHAAHVDMQMAAFALSQGWSDMAITLADQGIPVVEGAENAALLASFLLIRAEALELQGRSAEAAVDRAKGMAWAVYGFGNGEALKARVAAIAALVPDGFRG